MVQMTSFAPQKALFGSLLCRRMGRSRVKAFLVLCLLSTVAGLWLLGRVRPEEKRSKPPVKVPMKKPQDPPMKHLKLKELKVPKNSTNRHFDRLLFHEVPIQPKDDDNEPPMTFEALSQSYLKKRGRSPPLRFKEWYDYAKKGQCFLDRYDRIYKDLKPFWNMTAAQFQERLTMLKDGPSVKEVTILNGKIVGQNLTHQFLSQTSIVEPVSIFYADIHDKGLIIKN
jgi:hypothetical protein